MSKIFSSEKRIFIVSSLRKLVCIQFANLFRLSLCWSMSDGWTVILYGLSFRSFLSTLRTEVSERFISVASFTADSGIFLFTFWMVVFVGIVRGLPGGLFKSAEPVSRNDLHHRSIVRSPTVPFRSSKIFGCSFFWNFEKTRFWISLLFMT